MTLLASIVEAARSLAPAVPVAGLVGAGCAVLALRRSIVTDAAAAATERARLSAQVEALASSGARVASEFEGVRLGLDKLGEQFAHRGERLAAIEHDHDALAGRVTRAEHDCAERHPLGPAVRLVARGGEPGEDADPDNSAGGVE